MKNIAYKNLVIVQTQHFLQKHSLDLLWVTSVYINVSIIFIL